MIVNCQQVPVSIDRRTPAKHLKKTTQASSSWLVPLLFKIRSAGFLCELHSGSSLRRSCSTVVKMWLCVKRASGISSLEIPDRWSWLKTKIPRMPLVCSVQWLCSYCRTTPTQLCVRGNEEAESDLYFKFKTFNESPEFPFPQADSLISLPVCSSVSLYPNSPHPRSLVLLILSAWQSI